MTDLESFEKKMLDNALLCSKALKAHDLAATAQNYEERLQVLTANLEEIKSGENPLAILIAERCCVIFELDYTTDQAKKDRLSDQLCNLNDAMDYM